MQAEAGNAIRRMLRPPPAPAGPVRIGAARAMRLALMRAGQEALGLRLAVREAGAERHDLDTMADRLPAPGLLLHLADRDGQGGVMALCPQVLAAVIEMQTTGSVTARTADPRPVTATDVVLSQELAVAVLAALAALSAEADGLPAPAGWRVAGWLADPRAVAMRLPETEYEVWTCALDMADGARTGTLTLAMPSPRPVAAQAVPAQGPAEGLLSCPARLEAELARLTLPLCDVRALAPGAVVPLTGVGLDAVSLIAPGGVPVARARLGRLGDRRAVRLTAASVPEALDPPADGGPV